MTGAAVKETLLAVAVGLVLLAAVTVVCWVNP